MTFCISIHFCDSGAMKTHYKGGDRSPGRPSAFQIGAVRGKQQCLGLSLPDPELSLSTQAAHEALTQGRTSSSTCNALSFPTKLRANARSSCREDPRGLTCRVRSSPAHQPKDRTEQQLSQAWARNPGRHGLACEPATLMTSEISFPSVDLHVCVQDTRSDSSSLHLCLCPLCAFESCWVLLSTRTQHHHTTSANFLRDPQQRPHR